MKLIPLTACLIFFAIPLSQAADLFTPQPAAPNPTVEISFKSAGELLAATRSGDILKWFAQIEGFERSGAESDPAYDKIVQSLGRQFANVLRNDYKTESQVPVRWFAQLLKKITYYDLAKTKSQKLDSEKSFQLAHDTVSRIEKNAQSMKAIDALLKSYENALREYIVAEKVEIYRPE